MAQVPRRVSKTKTRVEVLAEINEMLKRADDLAQTVSLRTCRSELKGAVKTLREQVGAARDTSFNALQLDVPEPPKARTR